MADDTKAAPVVEGLFMDAEEIELLQRYHADNPSFVSFTDTDDRVRTLEERLSECDLEKIVKKCHTHLRERRQLLTRDQDIQTLPLRPTVPSVLHLRQLRTAVIDGWSETSHQAPFVNIADALAKEVAVTQESRTALPYILRLLIDHYKRHSAIVSRKAVRYLARWNNLMGNSEGIVALNRAFLERMKTVQSEYEFCLDALRVVETYSNIYCAATGKAKTGGPADGSAGAAAGGAGASAAAEIMLSAPENDARLAEELQPMHLRAYIARLITESRTHKKFDRFVSRCRLISQLKRYEIHGAVVSHLTGGFMADGSEMSNGIPLALKEENEVLASLTDFCACFRVPTPDQSNMQQFLYHAGKKYTAVFESQVADWQFASVSGVAAATAIGGRKQKGGGNAVPADLNAPTTAAKASSTNAAASGKPSAVKTYLRESSSWMRNPSALKHVTPGWQQRQDALLHAATSADGEARTLLKAELAFLAEHDIAVSTARWKTRSDTVVRRSGSRNLRSAAMRSPGGGGGGGGGAGDYDDAMDVDSPQTAARGAGAQSPLVKRSDVPLTGQPLVLYQRLHVTMQLRFVRTREFRRRLLSTLNYFASVLRLLSRDTDPHTRSMPFRASKTATMKLQPLVTSDGEKLTRLAMDRMIVADLDFPSQDPDTFAADLQALYDVPLPTITASVLSADGSGGVGGSGGATFASALDPTARDGDSYENNAANGTITVRRSDGCAVLDTWALEQLAATENYLLVTGAYFIGKHNAEVQTAEVAGLFPPSSPMGKSAGGPMNVSLLSSLDAAAITGHSVDYATVVEDLFESETWFTEGKMRVLDVLRECYEHATDDGELAALSARMRDLIFLRPRIDLTDVYFSTSYTREVINLELGSTIGKEIITSVISDERKVAASLNPPVNVPRPAAPRTRSSVVGVNVGSPDLQMADSQNKSGLEGSINRAASMSGGGANGSSPTTSTGAAGAAAAMSGSGFTPSESTVTQAKNLALFGLPDATIQDTRLFFPLFASSSVINILDVYESLGSMAYIHTLVEHNVACIAQRFGLLHNAAAMHLMEREVLQEMLLSWRVLVEEDRICRSVASKTATEAESGQDNAIDSIAAVDKVVAALLADEEGLLSAGSKGTTKPAASGGAAALRGGGSGSQGPQGAGCASGRATLPPPSRQVEVLVSVADLVSTRRQLMNALYDTELYYAIHRRQGKIMGVTVKKSQLDPIDFETRRAFVAVDEFDALKDSTNPLEEVLSVKAELLVNLSIAEFDANMAQFDLVTIDGVRRLLQHNQDMFRLAYTVQVCTKNMLTSIALCHMALLDCYVDQISKIRYENAIKVCTNLMYPPDPTTGALRVRCRLPTWPGFAAPASAADPEAFNVDRATLQKLFVSVNGIKSHHRKAILTSMNERTADIMLSKKPETLRRVLRDLKMALVGEYCVNTTFSTYQYASKYHIAALSHYLTKLCQDQPMLSFFTIGTKGDMVRPAPRGAAAVGDARRPATCMVTKNGKLDESRYLPHIVQTMQLDFTIRDKTSILGAATGLGKSGTAGGGGGSGVETAGTASPSTFSRTNFFLTNMARVLHHWSGIVRMLRGVASLASPATAAILKPELTLDAWRGELVHIGNELELLRDPTDITAVVTYLYQAHSSAFLRTAASLSAVKFTLARYNNHKGAEKVGLMLRALGKEARGSAHGGRIGQQHQLDTLNAALKLKSADEMLKISPFHPPLLRVKLPHTGDIDAALADSELMPPTSIPSHPDEKEFYGELAANPFLFVGDELLGVYPSLDFFLLSSITEDRKAVCNEAIKIDSLVEETRDELPAHLAAQYTATAKTDAALALLLPHHELLRTTVQRDQLKELFFLLYVSSISNGWMRVTKSQKASNQTGQGAQAAMEQSTKSADESADGGGGNSGRAGAWGSQQYTSDDAARRQLETMLDDIFSRVVLSRGRVIYERELAEKNESRSKKKGRSHEKEIRRRQVLLIVMEINKLLIDRSISEALVVQKQLEEMEIIQETATVAQNKVLANRTSIFSEFVTLVMSRALCTRSDGDRTATYHIPEASLTTAMEVVGRRISANEYEIHAALCNISEATNQKLLKHIVVQDLELAHLRHRLDLLGKSIARRVQSSIADTKFGLLSRNSLLEKQLQALEQQLQGARETIRDEVRVEYDERIADLQSQLLLSEDRFKSFKRKMARDMQHSLEEIKRQAMLNVGKMENAPLHMKRQALKIAITDDEVNTLKEQNSEFKLAIVKTKLWYELKLMRAKAAYDKQLHDSTHSLEASREQYWSNRQVSEGELVQLKQALSTSQHTLSQAELEVEMLRNDLQTQLTNKKDLVASKVQSTKQLEELQRKLRKFDKWTASNIDLDKLVADYEHSKSVEAGGADGGAPSQRRATSANGGGVDPSPASSFSRPHSTSGSGGGVSSEEHKRLLERLDKEKKLKEKAFAKIDEMRAEDSGTSEAMIWQRKFFEASAELTRVAKESEQLRTVLASHGIPHAPAKPITAGHGYSTSANASTPTRPPTHSAPSAVMFSGSKPTTPALNDSKGSNSAAAANGGAARPPPSASKFPSQDRYSNSATTVSKGQTPKK